MPDRENSSKNVENNSQDYEVMLTTVDNPYDPFTQFDEWLMFDEDHGYHTCSYLARIAKDTDGLSDEESSKETERAIDEILMYDFANIYKKVILPAEIAEKDEPIE